MKHISLFVTFVSFLFFGLASQAYLAIHESGKVLNPGEYKIHLSQQLITDPGTFGSLTAGGSLPLDADSEIGFKLGTGFADYHFVGQYKWIPYPDFEEQPAIGAIGGILVAKPDGINETGVFAGPIVSKNFSTEYGSFDSYISVPLYGVSYDGDLQLSGQLIFGSLWKTYNFEKLQFTAEMGLRINDNSFSYISIGALLYFGDDGIRIE